MRQRSLVMFNCILRSTGRAQYPGQIITCENFVEIKFQGSRKIPYGFSRLILLVIKGAQNNQGIDVVVLKRKRLVGKLTRFLEIALAAIYFGNIFQQVWTFGLRI